MRWSPVEVLIKPKEAFLGLKPINLNQKLVSQSGSLHLKGDGLLLWTMTAAEFPQEDGNLLQELQMKSH